MLKYESLCSSSEACGGLCLGLELGVAVESVWALLPGMDEGLGGCICKLVHSLSARRALWGSCQRQY